MADCQPYDDEDVKRRWTIGFGHRLEQRLRVTREFWWTQRLTKPDAIYETSIPKLLSVVR